MTASKTLPVNRLWFGTSSALREVQQPANPLPGPDVMKKKKKGFTFVEMMVVMVVLGALSSMAVPRLREYKQRAYIAAMQSDLGNLKIAQESHWGEHLQYSTDTTKLDFRVTSDVLISITSKDIVGGYTAVATHTNLPGRQCATAMGPEAAPKEPGTITCGPVTSGSAAIPATP